jgi:AcrR family transcriptional regulator
VIGTSATLPALPPVALTRADRKEQTRQALLAAAAELFTTQGIEATSVDQVAASVGLTRGAVYASFRTKQELVMAVGRAETLFLDLSCLSREELPLRERLVLLGRELWQLHEGHSPSVILKDLEYLLYAVRHPQDSQVRFGNYRDSVELLARELNRVAQVRVEPLPTSAPLLATALIAMLRGLSQQELREQRRLSVDEISGALSLLAG